MIFLALLLSFAVSVSRPPCIVDNCGALQQQLADELVCRSEEDCMFEIQSQFSLIVPSDAETVVSERFLAFKRRLSEACGITSSTGQMDFSGFLGVCADRAAFLLFDSACSVPGLMESLKQRGDSLAAKGTWSNNFDFGLRICMSQSECMCFLCGL
jgi:hypothetical protein